MTTAIPPIDPPLLDVDAVSKKNHAHHSAIAPYWSSVRNAADAVSAIGAVLHRDVVARNCEGEGEPLGDAVLDGLYAGIEELGDLIVARLEAIERYGFVAPPGSVPRPDETE